MLMYGGGSGGRAARGAFRARILRADVGRGLEQTYLDECARLGNEPGMCFVPAPDSATSIFVAEDVDRAWERIGPFMLHDARMYASWLGDTAAASKSNALTVDGLRAESRRVPRAHSRRGRRIRPHARRARAAPAVRRLPARTRVGVARTSSRTACSPRCADAGPGLPKLGPCSPRTRSSSPSTTTSSNRRTCSSITSRRAIATRRRASSSPNPACRAGSGRVASTRCCSRATCTRAGSATAKRARATTSSRATTTT